MIERIRYESGRALRLGGQVALAALVLLYCVGCVSSTLDREEALEGIDTVSTAVVATLTAVAVAQPELASPNTIRGQIRRLLQAERATATARAPTRRPPTPRPQPWVQIGDEVRLHVLSPGADEIAVAVTRETYSEMFKALSAKDMYGLSLLMVSDRVFLVDDGTKILVIDTAFGLRKVRVLEGP